MHIVQRNSTSWNEYTASGSIIQNAVVTCGLGFSPSPKIDNNYIRGSICIQGSSPVISNNDITSYILILGGEVNAQIIGNDIKGLIFGYHRGTVLVSNNVITGTYSDAWTGGGITCAGYIITNNIIKNFKYGVHIPGGNVTIKNNIITDNHVGIELGREDTQAGNYNVTIENNLITENTKGISLTHLRPHLPLGELIIQYNNLVNNKDYSFYLNVGHSVDMPNNWWGSSDTAAINQTIHDNNDDFNLGIVNYMPFLTQPNPDAPQESTQPIPTLLRNQLLQPPNRLIQQ